MENPDFPDLPSSWSYPSSGTGDRRSIERGPFALDGADCKAALKGWEAWMEGGDVSLVTLSATYGAGGSEVGPALAQRLGVPFVDRLIPSEVAARLAIGLRVAYSRDERSSGVLSRLLVSLAPIARSFGVEGPAASPLADRDFREKADQVIFELAENGQAVILGRAGAVVLRDDPRALHVRLDGPAEARLTQAMRIQGVERSVAERRMKETDRARHAYVRHFHHADARNPALYHLLIDSTMIDLTECVEIIALAAKSRARQAAQKVR